MVTKIIFGTDGWRGVIADDYTFENVRRCAHGMAQYLLDTQQAARGIVIGYDTRFQSDNFARASAQVVAAHGVQVYLVDRATPTPVISYAILHKKAAGAINITASHNPPTWNGFKVRADYGGAIAPDGLKQIEARIPAPEQIKEMDFEQAARDGRIEIFDPKPAYLKHIGTLVDIPALRKSRLKVAVDSMWGAGAGWFNEIFADSSVRVVEIHGEHNPAFPEMNNPEPIRPNIDHLMELVKRESADVGLATDGDADRMGGSTEKGVFIDQLQMYALLAYYLLEVRGLRGPIVKTINTTSMLDALAKKYDVPLHECGVGFKYVAPKMLETNALVGGEESGGYAFRGHLPERDGILGGLFLLDLIVKSGKAPSRLIEYLYEMLGPHYYERIDTDFPEDQRAAIMKRLRDARPNEIAGLKVSGINTMDGFKFIFANGGWLVIRFSGTEPIMRFYVETTKESKVKELLEAGLKLAGLK